jgi:RHS repeat-associated protein
MRKINLQNNRPATEEPPSWCAAFEQNYNDEPLPRLIWRRAAQKLLASFLVMGVFLQPIAIFAQTAPAPSPAPSSDTSSTAPSPAPSPAGESAASLASDADASVDNSKTPQTSVPPPSVLDSGSGPTTFSGDPHNEDQKIALDKRLHTDTDDLTGGFHYSYPLTVPPGRKGMQPDLNLVYSSSDNAENSPFGYGWSISIPYIERINKDGVENLYHRTNFSSSLDGELASTTGEYYGPKVEDGSFRKYQYVSSAYWTITDKSGTIYTFGSTASTRQDDPSNSNHVYRWMLEKVKDTNGNYITYTYTKDNGQIYPNTITYTNKGGVNGIFEIDFSREARPDNIATSSTFGFPVLTRYRTNEIQALIGSSWVKKYSLGYTTGDNSYRSVLDTVTETGKDESGTTIALPAVDLNYQTSRKSWVNTVSASTSFPSFIDSGGTNQGVEITDVNGDGLADVIESRPGVKHININTGDGVHWVDNQAATSSLPNIVDASGNDQGVRFADVDGDGFTDIVQAQGGSYQVLLNNRNGTGWTASAGWTSGLGDFVDSSGNDAGGRIADVNGDGLPDIIAGSVRLNNGNGTGWTEATTTWNFPTAILSGTPLVDQGVRLADVDGDGLVDVIKSKEGSASKVYINKGKDPGWVEDTRWGVPEYFVTAAGVNYGVRLVDVNGDGLVDLVRCDAQGGSANKVYINISGIGWVYDSAWSIPSQFVDNAGSDLGTRIVDMDGDNLPDVIRQDARAPSERKLAIHQGKKVDLVSRIAHSEGGKTEVSYKPTAQYTSASGALLNSHLPFVLYTARTIAHNDGLGATTSLMTYDYSGGRYYFNNSHDRRIAGFATTTVQNAPGNVTKKFFHQGNSTDSTNGEYSDHFSKIGKPYRLEQYDNSSNLYTKTMNRWENYDLTQHRNFVKLATTTDFSHDGNSDQADKAVGFNYDNANGNITQKVEWGKVTGSNDGTFTDTGSDKFVTRYFYTASSTGYMPGLPSKERVLTSASSTVKETKYYYDSLAISSVGAGNETKRELWTATSTYKSVQHAYNSYGLPTSETDPRGKVTTLSYDPQNLYVATSTNPLSHVTGYVYDYSNGKPKRTVDANSLTSEIVFDALDRVKETKQPDLTTPSTRVTNALYTYTDSQPRSVQETHYLDGSTSFDVYKYFDGLGRLVQDRREGESFYSVHDLTYNNRGLLDTESVPYFSYGSSKTTATTTSALFTTYSYDALDRASSVANAAGTTNYAYSHWKTTITDPNSHPKRLTKDTYGNLTVVNEYNSGSTATTTYEYDYLGDLTKITDAAANVRNFTYDGLGRRTASEDLHASGDASYGSWTYAFDNAGNVKSYTDPKNHTVNMVYDDINRPTSEDFTGGSGTEITYAYDACTYGKSQLCAATTTASGLTYSYTPLGAHATEINKIGSTKYLTKFEYDRQGNQTKITYPDSSEATYAYNTAGYLESVSRKESGDAGYTAVITDFNYSPMGQVSSQAYHNGAVTVRDYDKAKLYRLKRILTNFTGGVGGAGSNEDDGYLVTPADDVVTSPPPALTSADGGSEAAAIEPVSSAPEPPAPPPAEEEAIAPVPSEESTTAPISEPPATPEVSSSTPLVEEAAPSTAIATSTPAPAPVEEVPIEIAPAPASSPQTSLVKNSDDAKAWRAYHEERVAYLKTRTDLPSRVLEQATHGQDKFEKSLVQKGYTSQEGGEIKEPGLLTRVWNGIKWLFSFLLPKSAYAYVFGTETFESCSKVPCSFNQVASWGSATSTVDSTSKITGVKSLKAEITGTGDGAGAQKKNNLNASEMWVQFKVWIPNPMVWGASGYANILILQNSSGSDRVWLSVENYGTARLTLGGDHIGYVDTGLNLTQGSSNTIEIRVKTGTSNGDVDIWLNNSTEGSPNYNVSGTMDVGTVAIDKMLAGLAYTPEEGVSTTYYDDITFDSAFIGGGTTPTAPTSLLTEGATNPTNVSDPTPEFSAIYNDADTTDVAPFYQIQVSTSTNSLQWLHPKWDSAKTAMASTTQGTRSPDISYGGTTLASSTTYYWRIKFWDDDRLASDWSSTTGTSTFSLAASGGGGSSGPLTVNVVQNISYTYDAVGNIRQIQDESDTGTGKLLGLSYDHLNRLTSASTTVASSTSFSHTYAYDSLGNFTSKSDLGSYSYAGTANANPHAATSINSVTQTYDQNGNLTNDGTFKYRWNYKNQLTRATSTTATSSFSYDYAGARVTTFEAGATTTIPNNLYSVSSATTTKNIYANGMLVATVETTGSGGASTIAVDATASSITTGYNGGPVTKHMSLTTSGSNRLLVLFGDIWQDSAGTGSITSATYNGVSLTKATSTRLVGMASEIWYLAAPATGSSTLSVTITGATDAIKLGAASYTGVDQSSPLDAVASARGSSGNPSANVTTLTANDVVTATLSRFSTTNASTNRTSIYNDHVTSTLGAASYQLATTTASYKDTYTGSAAQDWSMAMAAFKPASGGSSTTTVAYVHTDHLGGSSAITNDDAQVIQVVDYYPYGNLRLNNQYDNFNEKRKFTGHEYDSSTGLSYMEARYESGTQGRFLSEDAAFLAVGTPGLESITKQKLANYLSNPQGLNSYSYVVDNPLNTIDPTGNYWWNAGPRASGDIYQNRSNIINAAHSYPDVRPDILGANIYEERFGGGNVNPGDIPDVPFGILGLDSSIGLAQVRISTAEKVAQAGYYNVDNLYKETFSFGNFLPERLKIIRLLNNPKTNTIIAAGLLQQKIDEWKSTVPDIANNPELLGSLYNYSEVEPTKEGYKNPFGERVAESTSHVKELLGSN